MALHVDRLDYPLTVSIGLSTSDQFRMRSWERFVGAYLSGRRIQDCGAAWKAIHQTVARRWKPTVSWRVRWRFTCPHCSAADKGRRSGGVPTRADLETIPLPPSLGWQGRLAVFGQTGSNWRNIRKILGNYSVTGYPLGMVVETYPSDQRSADRLRPTVDCGLVWPDQFRFHTRQTIIVVPLGKQYTSTTASWWRPAMRC